MHPWTCPLVLDSSRNIVAGSQDALVRAIRRGADLRIYTEFRHNEHIDVRSLSDEKVREVAEFAVTYLVEDCWAAGLMSLRQPRVLARRDLGRDPQCRSSSTIKTATKPLAVPTSTGNRPCPPPRGDRIPCRSTTCSTAMT